MTQFYNLIGSLQLHWVMQLPLPYTIYCSLCTVHNDIVTLCSCSHGKCLITRASFWYPYRQWAKTVFLTGASYWCNSNYNRFDSFKSLVATLYNLFICYCLLLLLVGSSSSWCFCCCSVSSQSCWGERVSQDGFCWFSCCCCGCCCCSVFSRSVRGERVSRRCRVCEKRSKDLSLSL